MRPDVALRVRIQAPLPALRPPQRCRSIDRVNTDPHEAMLEDINTLVTAVGPIGGPVTLIASPARAVAIGLRVPREPPFTELGSPALADHALLAVAVIGLASAIDSIPELDTSK